MKNVVHTDNSQLPPALDSTDDENPIGRSKILIVDDSATIRATLSRALKNEFPYVDAANGEKAWHLIESDESIKLVVTDLTMPELDGFGLIKRMRNSDVQRIRSMPVIVVTGENDTAAREKAFVTGANDFISKSSDHVEFLARVRSHEKLARTINELEESRRFLREQANTDPLTKLANRRSFFQMASSTLEHIRRQKEHFSIMMIDIDHFKPINDTYGHQAGDHVLLEVSKVLAHAIREGDILARMGGEEFVVASPYTNRLAAIVLSERLRKSIETSIFDFEENQIPVTISLGVASLTEQDEDIDKLLAIADSRLYLAKQKGRNCICASDKTAGQERLVDMEMVCPKLDEALTMIRHGNTFRLMPHLYELSMQLMPLLELINDEGIDPALDIQSIKKSFNALDK